MVITDDNPNSRAWKTQVKDAAKSVYKGPLLEGPIEIVMQFVFLRPLSHRGKKGLKPSAPRNHVTKPDVLKLARSVEDALTGVIYRDDSQIVHEVLTKTYAIDGEGASAHVTIRTVEANYAV